MTDLRGINRLAGRLGTSNCKSLFSSCFVSSAIASGVFSSFCFPVLENFEELSVAN